ncbi:probable acylaminoacyl-peptidase [Pedobacter sp. BAL39]|uniref:S9 family peptidase n=1 Tax=Pedobacter sp. BAL39 TaxID=391596 RepID=UPI00015593F8|nr:prolyl oligopeptidase family serine peptidase [Pedobacter sp. BAL39]EDM36870.1 probable acylaminoacyl-peptidase [Pedobacter sp. BAL39]
MYKNFTLVLIFLSSFSFAQKKPLDHSVYDSWESILSKQLSNNGIWAMYGITQQEGDATLYMNNQQTNASLKAARGFNGSFSNDSRYAVFMIKPFFKDTRLARIKKKKVEEMTRDSLGIANLANLTIIKIPRVKSFRMPEKGTGILAYQLEKPLDTARKKNPSSASEPTKDNLDFFADDEKSNTKKEEGTDLIVRNLLTGTEQTFKYVKDYAFSKNGKQLVFATLAPKKDSTARVGVFVLNTEKGTLKNLVKGKGNFRNFVFDEESEYLAFLGEQDPEKQEVKNYNIYYNSLSLDTAQVLVDNSIPGMPAKWSVSGDGKLMFSKDSRKLFFGIAPLKQAKDTTLVDFEHAKLDIWGYKDDYLQPMQLKNAEKESQRSYLTVIDIFNGNPKIVPLTDLKTPDAALISEGNADHVLASTDFGNRVQLQWTVSAIRDYYLVNTQTGQRKKIISALSGSASASPDGKYVIYFNEQTGLYHTYQIETGKISTLNEGFQVSLVDEENDVPAAPDAYGIAGWTKDDKSVLIYDRYDIWSFSPDGKTTAQNVTGGYGRQNKITFRYVQLDEEQRFLERNEHVWLTAFNNVSKENGFYKKNIGDQKAPELVVMGKFKYSTLIKAKDEDAYVYDKGNYQLSPNVYVSKDLKSETKLSNTNLQQQNYNWGTAELVTWTTPKGFKSDGILYKPENFDPLKKYPMIVYFYEKLSEGLYSYQPPAPTPSRLNIPFFVSNGYLVFAPDISYEKGYPGRSAEEFINSGVEALKKNSWVDGTKIGIQGQSWGGYQVAHLITRTNMYAAAWSGAPVVNMTSAYGGMRWESGMNRQFQYERTQSRIGATLWEKPELYIENSPLFSLPKVNTPVVIMANDADGAVPWYQGIEMFTGLRRLGKPVWLLNYNNEAHNLILRQNRKDIQIREQQFFDYYLKGAKAPAWMTSGIPATEKGKTWGFDLTDEKP